MTDNVDDMTPAEQAVVDAEAARIASEQQATQAQAEAQAKAVADAAAAEAAAKAAEEAAKAAAAAPPPAPVPQVVVPTVEVDKALSERDFAKERETLNEGWESGDLTQAEWAKKFAEIAQAEATLIAQRTISEATAKAATAVTTQVAANAEQAFDQAASALMAANPDIAGDQAKFAMFQGLVNTLDASTGGKLAPADLLARAEQQFRQMIPKPAAPKAPDRQPDLSTLPPRLSEIPQAAVTDARGSADVNALAALGIEDLEARFAGMSDAQMEALLAQTPGSNFELRPVEPRTE